MGDNKAILQEHNERLSALVEQVDALPEAGADGGSAVIEPLSVTTNGTYTAPDGVDGYSPIEVNVPTPKPVLTSLAATKNGTYTPPSGTDGYNSVTVNVSATASIPTYTVSLANAPVYIAWVIYVKANGSVSAYDEIAVSSIVCRQGLVYIFMPGYTITASGGVTHISTDANTAGTPDSIFVFNVTGNGTLTFAAK